MRTRSRLTIFVTTLVLSGLGLSPAASAATNPTSAVVIIRCGILGQTNKGDVKNGGAACGHLGGNGGGQEIDRLEWYSNGTLIYTENGPRTLGSEDGNVTFLVTGSNDPNQFNTFYVNPATSVLTAPDITVKVYAGGNGNKPAELVLYQPYSPVSSALWSKHSEDTTALGADIAAGDAATLAASKAYANAGDAMTKSSILNGNNTYTGNNTYNGTSTFNGNVIGTTASFSGGVSAASFTGAHVGDGAGLTNLDASNLASGTVPVARLSGTYNINISGNAATATTANNFSGALAGDVTGPQTATVLSRIQGVTLNTGGLAAGDILRYDGMQWKPFSWASTQSNFIVNGTAPQMANFNITGTGTMAALAVDGSAGTLNATISGEVQINSAVQDSLPGWNDALRFTNGSTAALTLPSGGLLFGMNADTNFYWANTTGGYYTMQLANNGNLTVGATGIGVNPNPTLTTASGSYFVIPSGAFFSSGTVYFASQTQHRGGVNNDQGTLTLTGSSNVVNSASTYFQVAGKYAIDGSDGYLRLNQQNSFPNGTYSPYQIQTDSQLDSTIWHDRNGGGNGNYGDGYCIDGAGNGSVANLNFIRGTEITVNDAGGGSVYLRSNQGGVPVVGTTGPALYFNTGGNGTAYVSGGQFISASDQRLKKDIRDLGEPEMRAMLGRLDAVRSVTFHYKVEEGGSAIHTGVIAQSMPAQLVGTGPDGMLGLKMTDTMGYVIAAVRGLRAETRDSEKALRHELVERDRHIADLEARLSQLEGLAARSSSSE